MPAIAVQCPHCARLYSIDGSLVGRKGRCKNCGNSFSLTPSGEIPGTAPPSVDELSADPPPESWFFTAPLPDKIGRFVIKARLGAGAWGVVYRALDPTLDREVALKVPHPEFQRDENAVSRFLREAKAAARLHHPHIVTIYETGSDGDTSYIASAFIPGRTLADAIEDGPFEPRRAARIVGALADALHAAHQQGIVHRDVKPANILVDAEDRPHLTDFGLARLAPSSVKLTKVGSILGTPAYLSPEQARGKSDQAEPASDQYSLGVTLYELLSGETPFAGPLEVVIFHTLNTPPPPLRNEHPEIPAELERICLKALSKKPQERYANCREMATALELVKVELEHGPVSTGRAEGSSGLTRRARQRTVAATVAAVLILLFAFGFLFLANRTIFKLRQGDSKQMPVAVQERLFEPAAESLVKSERGQTGGKVAGKVDLVPEPNPNALSSEVPPPNTPDRLTAADVARPRVTVPRSPKDPPVMRSVMPFEAPPQRRPSELGNQVDLAIREGVRYLKGLPQRDDGSWSDIVADAKTGTTSLITLALLTAGEKPESPAVRPALEFLRRFGPKALNNTYAVALQTLVFAAAEPERDQLRITNNVRWLERGQIKPGDPVKWPGSWSYSSSKRVMRGDSSNTQFVILALFAASEAGVPVEPRVWELSRRYWQQSQKGSTGGWAYTPDSNDQTASMTCAGISSLILTKQGSLQALARERSKKQSGGSSPRIEPDRQNGELHEYLEGQEIRNCGHGESDKNLEFGLSWLADHFHVSHNFGAGQSWKYYYLYGLERAGRLSGVRFFGRNDWYHLGAEELIRGQDKHSGSWIGTLQESDRVLATSFALLFLAKGRAPVLINKLSHSSSVDWNNDPDDVRNIVGVVSRDWRTLLTWQSVDPEHATVSQLLQAPIVYFNGHRAPDFSAIACEHLRKYVEKGGFIFAEACCGSREFDRGFKQLIERVFPEKQFTLKLLSAEHPVWKSKHLLAPNVCPLWGIDDGRRMVAVYSPSDLSCYWNNATQSPTNPAVINSVKVGQNVIEYVTSGKAPPEKLFEE